MYSAISCLYLRALSNISDILWQFVLIEEETRELKANTDLPQVTDKLYHIEQHDRCLIRSRIGYPLWAPGFTHSCWSSFQLSVLCCCFVCIRPVLNVASVSGLSIFVLFCLYSSCAQCCQCLWIVHFCFVLFVFVLCSMLPVSLDCPFLFCLYTSCAQCCQCLWIVHSWLTLWVSNVYILYLVHLPINRYQNHNFSSYRYWKHKQM